VKGRHDPCVVPKAVPVVQGMVAIGLAALMIRGGMIPRVLKSSPSMDDIIRIRDRIDELDQEIVRLLKNRYENARLLGMIKGQRGLDYRDPEREKIILRKIERAATALDLDPKLIRPIFEQIFAFSVQAQRDLPEKSGKRLDQTKILIVGGTGGMGRFFARLASLQGAKVKLAGREIN